MSFNVDHVSFLGLFEFGNEGITFTGENSYYVLLRVGRLQLRLSEIPPTSCQNGRSLFFSSSVTATEMSAQACHHKLQQVAAHGCNHSDH